MDGMTRGLTKNTGDDWREIRTNGREREKEESMKKRKMKESRKEE